MTQRYFATYCKLEQGDADDPCKLNGNVLIIGAELALSPKTKLTPRGKEVAQVGIVDQGGEVIGYLPSSIAVRISELHEAGWLCRVATSVVGFDKTKQGFWCEVALICYRGEVSTEFDIFADGMFERIAKGEHPALELSPEQIEQVIAAQGSRIQTPPTKLPKLGKNDFYFKKKRSLAETLTQAAARKERGCYVGLVALIIVIALVIFLVFFR